MLKQKLAFRSIRIRPNAFWFVYTGGGDGYEYTQVGSYGGSSRCLRLIDTADDASSRSGGSRHAAGPTSHPRDTCHAGPAGGTVYASITRFAFYAGNACDTRRALASKHARRSC